MHKQDTNNQPARQPFIGCGGFSRVHTQTPARVGIATIKQRGKDSGLQVDQWLPWDKQSHKRPNVSTLLRQSADSFWRQG